MTSHFKVSSSSKKLGVYVQVFSVQVFEAKDILEGQKGLQPKMAKIAYGLNRTSKHYLAITNVITIPQKTTIIMIITDNDNCSLNHQ